MLLNFKAGSKVNFVSGIKFCVKAAILLNDLFFNYYSMQVHPFDFFFSETISFKIY